MAELITADNVKIYIADAGDVGSDLTSANEYQAQITNIDTSGGEQDVDSVRTFGGYADKEKPQSQIEVSFDVLIMLDSSDAAVATKWDTLNDRGVTKRMIAIQGGNATDGYYWSAWNNCRAINFDKEFSAEDEWKGKMTFKLSPATETGVDNEQVGSHISAPITDGTNGLTSWS